jgi:hypothetical protein
MVPSVAEFHQEKSIFRKDMGPDRKIRRTIRAGFDLAKQSNDAAVAAARPILLSTILPKPKAVL